MNDKTGPRQCLVHLVGVGERPVPERLDAFVRFPSGAVQTHGETRRR